MGERIVRVATTAAVREAARVQSFAVTTNATVAVNTHDTGRLDGFVLQIVNYDLDERTGTVRPITDVELSLPDSITDLRCHRPDGTVVRLWPQAMRNGVNRFVLPAIAGHAVVEGKKRV
jgi:hypothetical protein